MTDALAHRGPAGQGRHLAPGLALGHRRLAVTAPGPGGEQPFTSGGGRTTIAFDGQIYNHAELRAELARAGRTLRTRCDTEVLAELVDLRGPDALPALIGMFAFAAYNPREDSLLLVRDRFGEKPLYYAETRDGLLLFASELGALLATGLIAALIDGEAVADYLAYGYVPDPGTIYSTVRRLPAGHALTARRGQPLAAPRRWFKLDQREAAIDPDHAAHTLLERLDRAVARQRVADVPVGVLLSGDATGAAIASSMALNGARATVCALGTGATGGEREAAAQAAALYGADYHTDNSELDVESVLPEVARLFGEPFADSSAVPAYLACRLARRHVAVVLSGSGADVMFAGYDRYGQAQAEGRLRGGMPSALARPFFGGLGSILGPLTPGAVLRGAAEPAAAAYARSVFLVPPRRARALLAPGLREVDPSRHIARVFEEAGTDEPLLRAQAADIATWLPGRTLMKADRLSAAHGLERRSPFLDPELATFAASLPRTLRWQESGKVLLRTALADRMTEAQLDAPRPRAVTSALARFGAGGGHLADALLARTSWRDSGFFDEAAVARCAKAHKRGRADYGQALWSMVMFDAFLEAA
ncbi:asparagine synthase (glutamine-hydrolyzing) [Parvularcula dongshanensis]|uniref:asparagine synthase (glutamine-hydrolyzing) n=2 Tax=Parvularcula dongshanensis TaxID=1173995 RepID=A0A840HYU3_9PROT|nr:asparagine synthase (glutamine-hydrolyzing) [Parvularcula dongshanensis]